MHERGDVPRVSSVALMPLLHQCHAIRALLANVTYKHSETMRLIRPSDVKLLDTKLAELYKNIQKLTRTELTPLDPHSEG